MSSISAGFRKFLVKDGVILSTSFSIYDITHAVRIAGITVDEYEVFDTGMPRNLTNSPSAALFRSEMKSG